MTLASFPSLQASAGGLLALVVLLILLGWLVPRRVLMDQRRESDKALAREKEISNTWRQAYEVSERRAEIGDRHVSELLVAAQTTSKVIGAFPLPAAHTGDPDVAAV